VEDVMNQYSKYLREIFKLTSKDFYNKKGTPFQSINEFTMLIKNAFVNGEVSITDVEIRQSFTMSKMIQADEIDNED
jgi:hypothetical protein